MSLSLLPNPTNFQKTLGFNDFYWGEKNFPYPMGSVQLLGNIPKDRITVEGPPFMPNSVAERVAKHSVGWLLMTEDLPNHNNRVRIQDDQVFLEYTSNNNRAFNRLIGRWIEVLKSIENRHHLGKFSVYAAQKFGVKEVSHQCGTCRFGTDPQASVLDLNCRTHDVDNLYVVDSSFFPTSAAVNPSLTIIANALRVGEHLLQRLKCGNGKKLSSLQ